MQAIGAAEETGKFAKLELMGNWQVAPCKSRLRRPHLTALSPSFSPVAPPHRCSHTHCSHSFAIWEHTTSDSAMKPVAVLVAGCGLASAFAVHPTHVNKH